MNIIIKKDSGLYKLFKFAREYSFAGFIIERDNGIINSFSDVCTFIRHFILGILILLPLTYIIALLIVSYILYSVLYLPLTFLFDFGAASEQLAGTVMFFGLTLILVIYLILCTFQFILNSIENKKENYYEDTEPKKEPGTLYKIFEIISQKHSKFCKIIKVEDKKES